MGDRLEGPNESSHNEIQKLRASFCNGSAGLCVELIFHSIGRFYILRIKE
jgi:hypothetical protein